MTVTDARLKKKLAAKVGSKIDDLLEFAEKSVYGHMGGKSALISAKKDIQVLCLEVDADVAQMEEAIKSGTLKTTEYVKRWILRAAGVCDNLATVEEVQKLLCRGKAEGLREAVKCAKEEYDRAAAKVEIYDKAVEEGKDPEEEARPDLSASDDIISRKREAAEEKLKKNSTTQNKKTAAKSSARKKPR